MKVQLAFIAKDLPIEAAYQASVCLASDPAVVFGTTEVSSITASPVWNNLVTPNDDLDPDTELVVKVFRAASPDDTVATAQFVLRKVVEAHFHAAASFTIENSDGGAKIAIHATDLSTQQGTTTRATSTSSSSSVQGKLSVQFAAHKLPNTDFGLFGRNKTDGFLKIYSAVTGNQLSTSNVVKDDLDPVWDAMNFDLDVLCGGRLNAPIRITVWDKDGPDQEQYLGQVMITAADIINSKGDGKHFEIVKGGLGISQGTLTVVQASVQPPEVVSSQAIKHMEMVLLVLDSKREKLIEEIAMKQKEATEAATEAELKESVIGPLDERANELRKRELEARAEYDKVNEKYKERADLAKNKPCSGSLVLQLRATKLPDTDFGIRNKTDPIYEIFLENGERLLRSNTVENDLNPIWQEQILDVTKVGSLEKPIKIVVSDKDGGSKQTALGSISTTLKGLIDCAQSEKGQPLLPCKGSLHVVKADLLHFIDNVSIAKIFQLEKLEPATSILLAAKKDFDEAQAKLEKARAETAAAKELARKAQDALESVQLALDQLETGA